MTEIKPRFEFRTFGQNLGHVDELMRKHSKCEIIRESNEIYIMSAGNNENNTKIRDAKMDIKVFVKEEKGLQQWNPRMKGEFPMKTEVIRDEVFPAFGVSVPDFSRAEYTLEQYLDEIIKPHPDLSAARIFKRRFAFTINGVIAETAEIHINGARIQTACLESTDLDAVNKAREMVDLADKENINYLMAIKRVIGMEPLPEDK
ncbi:MAG: hypothetical protein ISR65_05200 [Bacteriovoracaceae bacterium]|nr:hypothetical protein [Bacteriovoracaceae bacterium]